MPTPKKATPRASSSDGDHRFPAEAYRYNDDVTPEAVEAMRKKASKTIDSEEWEVVDGFGLSV